MDDVCSEQRPFIGDDWVFTEVLLDPSGDALDLTGKTVGAAYFAPPGTTPAETDISAAVTIVPDQIGTVRVVVSKDITSLIRSLPAGRKRPPAHLQIFVIDGGLRTTRRVLLIDPVDPSTMQRRGSDREDGDASVYRRLRGFGFPTFIF
jgi:hypothetical protein